jgi:D-alanine-D-alanine ligase
VESGLYLLAQIHRERYDVHAVYLKPDGAPATPQQLTQALPALLANRYVNAVSGGPEAVQDLMEYTASVAVYPPSAPTDRATFLENVRSHEYDIVLPALHGRFGEDGSVQGLLEALDVPIAGCAVPGSVAGLDKQAAKLITAGLGIRSAEHLSIRDREWAANRQAVEERVERALGYPVFVKPCSLGSSIGLGRAANADALPAALEQALRYDTKVIVEREIRGKEYGLGLIGNASPRVSVPVEYALSSDSFDYEAKFGAAARPDLIPAPLDRETVRRLQDLALRVWDALDLCVVSRVDCFIENGEVLFNEVNTVPGFGAHSVFAALWEYEGLPPPDLIDTMVEAGFERHEGRRRLQYVHAAGSRS